MEHLQVFYVSCLACARDSQGDPACSSYLVKKWQQIVLEGGKLDDGRKLKGIRKQSTLLYLKSGGIRLHCKNLVERLLFESRLARGLFRLMNQLAIFALLLQAIQYTGDPSVQRGIFNNISKIVGHKDELCEGCHVKYSLTDSRMAHRTFFRFSRSR